MASFFFKIPFIYCSAREKQTKAICIGANFATLKFFSFQILLYYYYYINTTHTILNRITFISITEIMT